VARDEDFKSRRRRLEKEAEEGTTTKLEIDQTQFVDSKRIDEMIARAEPLIDQVNALYNLYLAGTERLPPNERRNHLDQLMTTITQVAKPTAAVRFRASGLQHTYQQHKERWDRMMRDLESGKIKRRS
jgi:hypothetical protein